MGLPSSERYETKREGAARRQKEVLMDSRGIDAEHAWLQVCIGGKAETVLGKNKERKPV